ncbi:MAG: glycosyl hydrolase [Endomicrobia bacterium]|nr:glycosyl hydrolase [Endomicrobiia bacterium]
MIIKKIRLWLAVFIAAVVLCSFAFAAPNPGGKASLRNQSFTQLGTAKVSSGVSMPYPTNRWFGSSYIYSVGAGRDYNPSATFKMAPRPLVFTTFNDYWSWESWGELTVNGEGYVLGFENVPANAMANNLVMNFGSNVPSYPTRYNLKVSIVKSDEQKISPDYTQLDSYSDWSATILCKDKNSNLFMKTTIGKGFVFTYNTYSEGVKPRIEGVWTTNSEFGSILTFYDKDGTEINVSTCFYSDMLIIRSANSTLGPIYYGVYTSSNAYFDIRNAGANNANLTVTFDANASYDNRFLSIALLSVGGDVNNAKNILGEYYPYAYNFIVDTNASYSFDKTSSNLNTKFNFTTENKRAADSSFSASPGTVVAIFPHHYRNGNITYDGIDTSRSFQTMRGLLNVLEGVSSFQTTYNFKGVLPALTFEVPANKTGQLQSYIDGVGTDKNFVITSVRNPDNNIQDTYYGGKALAKAANLIPVFHQASSYNSSNLTNRNNMIDQLKSQLKDWYSGSSGSKYFAYNPFPWGGIIGYPYYFGTQNYNDHHYHYGYFVYASALLAMFDPSFALESEYKGIVDLLIKDFANPPPLFGATVDQNFPVLRSFDVYEGHSWANGVGYSHNDGIDHESSSEAMNAWAAIILWGMVTNNQKFIDLGIYGYTTELEATKEYYFDNAAYYSGGSGPTNYAPYVPPYAYNSVGILSDNRIDYTVIWNRVNPMSQEIKGIQVLPLAPSMLYLGHNTAYAQSFYDQLAIGPNHTPSKWKSIWYRFRALFEPIASMPFLISSFETDSFTAGPAGEDEGSSLTYSYQFINFFNSLGKVNVNYYADAPGFVVMDTGSQKTYIAYNADAKRPKRVKFYQTGGTQVGEMTVLPRSFAKTSDFVNIETQSFGYVVFSSDTSKNVLVSGGVLDFDGNPDLNIIPASLPYENSDYIYLGPSFEITKDSGVNILSPIYLSVAFDTALIPSGYSINALRLVSYNNAGELVVTDNNPEIVQVNSKTIITVKIIDSGKYLLALSATPANANVIAYPNPYKPSKHGNIGIKFANLKQGAQIKIFNIAGEMVYSTKVNSDGEYLWDVNNNSGYKIASGIYIYHITSGGKTSKGKFAIER